MQRLTHLRFSEINCDLVPIIIRTISFFWLIQRIRGRELWIAEDRMYPVIPAFEFLEGIPSFVQIALFGITLTSLAGLLLLPRNLYLQIILVLSVLLSAISDVTMWSTWEYQYISMILVIALNRKNETASYCVMIFILACIYFYSGFHKFNGGFLHIVWKGLILRKFFGIENANIYVHYLGLAIPILEAIAGLALLFTKAKRVAAFFLIAMHFFIIVLLTSVQGFNIVLPWNVAMIVILHHLFIKEKIKFSPFKVLQKKNFIFFVLWAIMPAFSLSRYWDEKLSSHMYSGQYVTMIICINKPVPRELQFITKRSLQFCNSGSTLSVKQWANLELSLTPPSSDWYYKKVKKKFCYNYPHLKAVFYSTQYPYKKFTVIK